MTSPYWGALEPAIQIPRRNSLRHSAEIPKDDQSSNPKRASGSQRMSDSTMDSNSQILSPESSYFPDALAPRPPSFPYRANEDGQPKKRRQRDSQDSESLQIHPPPAAPTAPTHAPPPLSYRSPYNKERTAPQIPARSKSIRRADGPAEVWRDKEPPAGNQNIRPANGAVGDKVSIKDISKGNTSPRSSYKVSKSDYPILHEDSVDVRREGPVTSRSIADVATAAEIDAKRRRDWAPDRSPLQRLELALSSLTKEEKRARAEEAELLAQLIIPQRTTSISKPAQNKAMASKPIEPTTSEPPPLREAVGTYRSVNSKHKADLQQAREGGQEMPSQGTSFRERSALALGSRAATGATVAADGSLGRSLSKRLRKEPPGDPWYNRRNAAERTYHEIRPKEHLNTPHNVPFAEDYRDDELPVQKSSSKKIEQMTGRSTTATNRDMASNGFDGVDLAPEGVNEKDSLGKLQEGNSLQPHHHLSDFILGHHARAGYTPGQGLYKKPVPLEEWKFGSTGFLSAAYTDLDARQTEIEKNKAWWEAEDSGKFRSRPPRSRVDPLYDGGNEESNAPTTFKPALYLKCGPLLRYKGIRREPDNSLAARKKGTTEREIWRGSVLIVTADEHSDYVTPPTLRLFSQPADLHPPPPVQVDGTIEGLAPEYVDPIVGLPKIARDGSTLYVRAVEELDFGIDLSRDESDAGLYERQRSGDLPKGGLDGSKDAKASRRGRGKRDGEKVGKYLEVAGKRLDVEQGATFWRFDIEVELASHQQRIAYRINRGPSTGFWVPSRGEAMNIMFYSCNGFTYTVDPDPFSGPDPLWRDVLNSHQTRPFHCMIGGGDQLYNDLVMIETILFRSWLETRNPLKKHNAPFTPEMQLELETFYLNRYCEKFSQGLFSVANCQIPMINILDDHDFIDGYGSYPDSFMGSPVFMGLGAIAYRFYLLFQHHTIIDEGEETEPSWIIGSEPGPWIGEHSRSVYLSLGKSISFLGLDCRTERRRDEIVSRDTYDKVFDRCRREIRSGETKHLILLLGVPIAYPRLVWLENILTSRLLDPIRAAGRMGLFKDFINEFDGGIEILDDLDDHWCAKNHKAERNWLVEELQKLAAETSVRVTILGGDVHLGAIGRFYSKPSLQIPKDRDFRYIPNVISSAIVNAPPPEMMADMMNKRNKVHHLNKETDESMVPIFTHDVDNKPRNNKCLLPRRNWCSINVYFPSDSPRSSSPATFDGNDRQTPSPQLKGDPMRRGDTRGPSYSPDATNRPPLSGGLMRRLSRGRKSTDGNRPNVLTRTLSLTRKDFTLFRRNSSKRKPDDGGINGYGADSDESLPDESQSSIANSAYYSTNSRGNQETTAQAEDNNTQAQVHQRGGAGGVDDQQRPIFRRSPTDPTAPRGQQQDINLEGALEITMNFEREKGDPAGITVPYHFIVPALWYDGERESIHGRRPSALERLRSFGRGRGAQIDR